MAKNVYDTDCTTWSPQGRIFQIEYANEAVKLGTCAIGIRNKNYAVLVGLRRNLSKLALRNDKILEVDDHIGVTFSGVTADAMVIVRKLRSDCLNHRFVYDAPAPVEPLIYTIGQISQKNTQESGKRPFGVGLIIAGHDELGPHIFETTPSGDYYEYYSHAFGARCQSARTYLEENLANYKDSTELAVLLEHGLKAMCTAFSTETADFELSSIHVGIVGVDQPFRTLTLEEMEKIVRERNIELPSASNEGAPTGSAPQAQGVAA